MASNYHTIERSKIIEAKSPEELAEKYNRLVEMLQEKRAAEHLLTSVPLRVIDRNLFMSDGKYMIAVFYEDYIAIKVPNKKPSRELSEGSSAIPQDIKKKK